MNTYTMRREAELEIEPGEVRRHMWTLRDEAGALIDWDQYKIDLETRNRSKRITEQ
jgi:hypothetical protein